MTSIEKSKDTELIYGNLLETIDVGFYQVTLDGQMLNHNRAHNIILGYDPLESLESIDVRRFWQNPQDRDKYIEHLLNYGFTKNYICHALTKNGENIIVELNSYLIRDEDGEPIRIDGTFIDITEKYNLQRKLEESKEKYRLITENISDVVSVFDKNLRLIYINEHQKDISGFSYKEIAGKSPAEYIHKDDLERYKYSMENLIKTGSYKGEFRLRNKDGTYTWLELSAKRILNYNNEPNYIVVSRNIQKRKEAELKLKVSEERYRLISENANDLIRVLNEKFEFEYINESVHKRILGYESEDLIGKTYLPYLHPEDRRHAIRSTVRNLKKGKGSYQARFKDKDGNYKWFEFAGKIFYDSKGKKKILSIARDITERKMAELKLRESEEKYRLISETAYDLISVLNNKFKYEYVNENAFQQILGYSSKDILGKSALEFTHPNDIAITVNALKEGFKQGEGAAELRFRHKEGHWVWIEAKGKIYNDKDGKLKAIVISRDITDRKVAEKRLKESEKKSREAYNRANFYKDLFAHDINNILHIVRSSAELISYHLGDSEKSKVIEDIGNIINKQVKRGAKLVSNVHTLSKLEEEEIHAQPTEICKLMENAIDFVKKSHNGRIININSECAEDHVIINANDLLQDVFENILLNAVKYNENSNVEIMINVSKTQIDGKNYNKIEFIDNGIGVPDERKQIIFKRGNRELKGAKGMGLGLSLVKKILKTFNGKIWVEDKVKGDFTQGSNFIILLPELDLL